MQLFSNDLSWRDCPKRDAWFIFSLLIILMDVRLGHLKAAQNEKSRRRLQISVKIVTFTYFWEKYEFISSFPSYRLKNIEDWAL